MSPDVTGAVETVAAVVALGVVALPPLLRGRRELARVRAQWQADCDDMRPPPAPGPQRLADASGVDRDLTARFLERAAVAHGQGRHEEAARYRFLATGRSWADAHQDGEDR